MAGSIKSRPGFYAAPVYNGVGEHEIKSIGQKSIFLLSRTTGVIDLLGLFRHSGVYGLLLFLFRLAAGSPNDRLRRLGELPKDLLRQNADSGA